MKSRQCKDLAGNNTCHYVFEIADQMTRYKTLRILVQEKIGDLNKRNKLGFLPCEIDN